MNGFEMTVKEILEESHRIMDRAADELADFEMEALDILSDEPTALAGDIRKILRKILKEEFDVSKV